MNLYSDDIIAEILGSDILSPADIFILSILHAVGKYSHALIMERWSFTLWEWIIVWRMNLYVVEDVEFDFLVLSAITDKEKEPLAKPLGIYITLQEQIVLVFLALLYH